MSDEALTAAVLNMFAGLKAEAEMNFQAFMAHGERQFGGALTIYAPCSERRRKRYEASFRSELYTLGETRE